jgi:hypothetical protein
MPKKNTALPEEKKRDREREEERERERERERAQSLIWRRRKISLSRMMPFLSNSEIVWSEIIAGEQATKVMRRKLKDQCLCPRFLASLKPMRFGLSCRET